MAKPLGQMPYQTVGDLVLSFPAIESAGDYLRDLNLDTATARTSFTSGGVKFTREVFASPIDQVITIRLTADKPGQISFTAGLKTPQKATIETESPDTIVMRGVNAASQGIAGALKFSTRVRVMASGGKTSLDGDKVSVGGADSATLLIAAATSYKSFKDVSGDPEALTKATMAAASAKPFDAIRKDHIAEHQRLFRRVALDLGTTDAAKRPTDERIRDSAKTNDPQLATLYFQFGRYLLISCSRAGGQPATLQGLWNDSMNPPWSSKYTININTEMNYWPAEPTNLGECVEPLTAMVMDLTETGARTAKSQWGARGWVTHHNTDLWRASAPIDGPAWGFWPTGGAWLCLHLWDHYQFSGDRAYLAKIYPALKGASQFFLDTLVEEPSHKWLVTCPSLSPENTNPKGVSICAGPTMDMQIIRDLFTNCIRAGEILDQDKDFRDQLAATRARLAPNQIGKAGQLQEWLEDWDMQAPEIHHRHVSHLYGLFPSNQICPRGTPELAAAVRKSLEIRGDEATGWGIGWRLNLWRASRMRSTHTRFSECSCGRSAPIPTCSTPTRRSRSMAISAARRESPRCSSSRTRARSSCSPRCPRHGRPGRSRACARGGFEIDLNWKDGKLISAKIRSLLGQPCKLRYAGQTANLPTEQGKEYIVNGQLSRQ